MKESTQINSKTVPCLTPLQAQSVALTILEAAREREWARKEEDGKATTKQVDLYQVDS